MPNHTHSYVQKKLNVEHTVGMVAFAAHATAEGQFPLRQKTTTTTKINVFNCHTYLLYYIQINESIFGDGHMGTISNDFAHDDDAIVNSFTLTLAVCL